jgi:hypothetical protein
MLYLSVLKDKDSFFSSFVLKQDVFNFYSIKIKLLK